MIEQNPWWADPRRIEEDPHIKEFESSPIRWVPRIKWFFRLDRDVLYTLRGPRQVGKTTLLKLIIRELLKEVPPLRVLYFTVDLLSDYRELVDLIAAYEEYLEGMGVKGRKYIFLDEISSVEGWVKAIKYMVDTGKLRNTSLIMTGSHSLDIKETSERLPGRRGEEFGPVNKILMPMKFSEYVETLRPDLRDKLELIRLNNEERNKIVFNLRRGVVDSRLHPGMLYLEELRGLFQKYLKTGGVIRAVAEFIRSEGLGEPEIRNEVYEIYIRAVIGDMARWGYNENIGKRILRAVVRTMTTPVSNNAIAKETELGSHNTVIHYLNGFESTFLLNRFYPYQLDKGVPIYRKNKKIYFSDPFLFHAVRGWTYGFINYFTASNDLIANDEWRGRLVEMVVAGHLIRLLYRLSPSDVFTHHENIFYWRGKGRGGGEREVDFLLKYDGGIFPVEVKYKGRIRCEDMRGFSRFDGGVLLTGGGDLKVEKNVTIIPVEVFLLLI